MEYGAMANANFIFYDSRNAEAITSTGQVAIKFIERKFNEYFHKLLGTDTDVVLAVDTDSNYLRFGPVVRKFFKNKSEAEIVDLLDKIANEQLQPYIDNSYHELSDYLNSFDMQWKMKREVIASKGVFVAKKRYFMHILDDEGVRMKSPKLKVTGLEAVRSSTPEICREALKKAMKIILDKNEEAVQRFIQEFKKEFFEAHVLDICFPRSVSDIEKWVDSSGNALKGMPIAVRGAYVYNKTIRVIDQKEETIKSGDKVSFVYMKQPNRFKSNVLAFPNYIPKCLEIEESEIDKNTQFEKSFLTSLRIILGVVGWKEEVVNDLTAFF
jgi:DNA polymerase elongation subunit (family B)